MVEGAKAIVRLGQQTNQLYIMTVENGWCVEVRRPELCYTETRYVFVDSKELGKFISKWAEEALEYHRKDAKDARM